jgi:hypothetical protein
MIVLKCLGIFFIKNFLLIIPQLLTIFYFITEPGSFKAGIWTFVSDIIIFIVYLLTIYLLLFKTEWIIEKCNLENGFYEEKFSFSVHRSSVLSIIITITGLLILVEAIPKLCWQIVLYFQEKNLTHGQTAPSLSNVIPTSLQLIIGLLLIGNQRQLVNFIERKRRNTAIENEQI